MNIVDRFKNLTINRKRYRVDSDGVILVSYFNPLNAQIRHDLFKEFYDSIKHLPHLVVEGQYKSSKLLLDFVPIENKIITKLDSLNWCKEGLLNMGIDHLLLVDKYKYVFWLDGDIKFSNLNWMVDSCRKMRNGYKVIQPFKLIKHLKENEKFEASGTHARLIELNAQTYIDLSVNNKRSIFTDSWFSFGYQHAVGKSSSKNYEQHGHVGMAWGAHLDLIGKTKLYDAALIGGADHIMAHAFANHTYHCCIEETFSYDENALDYSDKLASIFKGDLSYVDGVVFHGWHGDINKRDYYRRIKNNSKEILDNSRKKGYIYETDETSEIVYLDYMETREVIDEHNDVPTIESWGGGSFGGGGASGSFGTAKEVMDLAKESGQIAFDGTVRMPNYDSSSQNIDSEITSETSEVTNTFS